MIRQACLELRILPLLVFLAALTWAYDLAAEGQDLDADGSPQDWRFPSDRISAQQWQIYLDETLAKPGVNAYEAAGQLIVEVGPENAIYVFTTPAHPAHPGVVIRQVVERDGHVGLTRRGHYAGDSRAYDRWWRQFDELDAKAKRRVQENLPTDTPKQ